MNNYITHFVILFVLFFNFSSQSFIYSQDEVKENAKNEKDKKGESDPSTKYRYLKNFSSPVFTIGAYQKFGYVSESYRYDEKNIDQVMNYTSEITDVFLKFGYIYSGPSGKGFLGLLNLDLSNWDGYIIESEYNSATDEYDHQFYNQKGWHFIPELKLGFICNHARYNLNIPSIGFLFGGDVIWAENDPNNDTLKKVRKNSLSYGLFWAGELFQMPLTGDTLKKSYFELKIMYLSKHQKYSFKGDPLEDPYPRIKGNLSIDAIGLGGNIGTVGLQLEGEMGFPNNEITNKSHNVFSVYLVFKADIAEILTKMIVEDN